jgi:DNA-directed RNA polymerase
MIPRVARRLEATLPVSRKRLPRPARLYSFISRRNEAPATATVTAQTPPPPDFPAFGPDFTTHRSSKTSPTAPSSYEISTSPLSQLILDYLERKPQLTILPTPIPFGSDTVDGYDQWYKDSKSQDMAGIIDACLHDLYDVPRAKKVFDHLRENAGSSILGSRLYNSVLNGYLGMSLKDPMEKNYWAEEAWKLYSIIESKKSEVHPTVKTYSIMLALWHT